jgi:hypothetical protein
MAAKFLCAILLQPRVKRLLRTDHFSVDGTLIETPASMKSFRAKERAAPCQLFDRWRLVQANPGIAPLSTLSKQPPSKPDATLFSTAC